MKAFLIGIFASLLSFSALANDYVFRFPLNGVNIEDSGIPDIEDSGIPDDLQIGDEIFGGIYAGSYSGYGYVFYPRSANDFFSAKSDCEVTLTEEESLEEFEGARLAEINDMMAQFYRNVGGIYKKLWVSYVYGGEGSTGAYITDTDWTVNTNTLDDKLYPYYCMVSFPLDN